MSDREPAETIELTEEQEDALTLEHNVAITAGAGTGKTTTLTERYMHILEAESGIGPEEIVTITFTNDAANEMRERIRNAVGDRLAEADPDEYERWRAIKNDLESGYVHTIHGFCSRLLREQVVDAPVRPEFEVYDETDATLLAQEVVRNTVGDRLADVDADVRRLARLWNRGTLEEVLVGLLGQRPESEAWADRWCDASPADYMAYVWETVHPIGPDFAASVLAEDAVRDALETIRHLDGTDLHSVIDPADDDGAATVQDIRRLLDEHEPLATETSIRAQQRFLDELCNYLTTNDGTRDGRGWKYWGSSTRWSDAGRDAEQERLEGAVETLFDALEPETLEFGVEVDRAGAHYVLALARTFETVRQAYEATKERQNALDYDDLIETVIAFLEERPAVRDRLREGFEYVMVDEVQDTDPRQWQLVKLLTSGDTERFDARNVFLVGDEKQSIYRFRGADVRSFGDARGELAAANPESVETNKELSGNFRTTAETLAFCNDVFDGENVFAPFGDGYAPFEARSQELTAEREEEQSITGRSEYLLVPDDDHEQLHGADYLASTPQFVESGDREAHAVAARLTRLLDDPPSIYDRDDDKVRPAEPTDVTILLRARTRLKAFERALDAYDVPYTVVGGTGFYESPEITALLNLLRVLEDPRDERALYAVLRSSLFGVTDDALARLRLEDVDLWAALGRADGELADARDLLDRWRRLAGTHPDLSAESATPWGTLLSQVMDETSFLASVAGDERPRQAAVNINRLREQLRAWEEAGVKTIAELNTRLERRREVETHAGEATIPEDADGVQIRTIHSAKGLEFPIVVVPELGTQFNFQANVDDGGRVYFDEIDLGETGSREPVLGMKSPTPDDAFATEDTLVRRVTRDHVRQHERAELKRLLYVAMTRARDHLLLSGVHEIETDEDASYRLTEPEEPDEANCWRDWLQPILLADDGVLDRIADTGAVEHSLSGSRYAITRPNAPISDWERDDDLDAVSLGIDVPEPEPQQVPWVVTATEYATLCSGDEDAELYIEDTDGTPSEDAEDDGLSATTLGTIVHRICETCPERGRWDSFVRDVAERNDENLTPNDMEQVRTYAERALAFLDEYQAELEITSIHEELSVTARFEDVRVIGDVDHLVVTPDAFHIIDYKTNDTTDRSIGDLASHYWPQLRVYAVALHQSDPTRAIHTMLYFTDAGTSRTEVLEPAAVADYESSIHRRLRSERE